MPSPDLFGLRLPLPREAIEVTAGLAGDFLAGFFSLCVVLGSKGLGCRLEGSFELFGESCFGLAGMV
jgi:hypothetical protein